MHRGTLEGQPVRILVYMGCDHTMISAGQVLSPKVDHSSVVPVLCVHRDTMQYPTAWVELQLGQWLERRHVVVAPNLLVDVLLGTDVYPMERVEVDQSLAVWTQSKQRQMERELAGAPKVQLPTPVCMCSLPLQLTLNQSLRGEVSSHRDWKLRMRPERTPRTLCLGRWN